MVIFNMMVSCLCLFCFKFICVKCKVMEDISKMIVLMVGKLVVFMCFVVMLLGVVVKGYIVLKVGYNILLVMVLFDVFFS